MSDFERWRKRLTNPPGLLKIFAEQVAKLTPDSALGSDIRLDPSDPEERLTARRRAVYVVAYYTIDHDERRQVRIDMLRTALPETWPLLIGSLGITDLRFEDHMTKTADAWAMQKYEQLLLGDHPWSHLLPTEEEWRERNARRRELNPKAGPPPATDYARVILNLCASVALDKQRPQFRLLKCYATLGRYKPLAAAGPDRRMLVEVENSDQRKGFEV